MFCDTVVLAACGKTQAALRAGLFRRLCVGKSRNILGFPTIFRLDPAKKSSLSPTAGFHHRLLTARRWPSLRPPVRRCQKKYDSRRVTKESSAKGARESTGSTSRKRRSRHRQGRPGFRLGEARGVGPRKKSVRPSSGAGGRGPPPAPCRRAGTLPLPGPASPPPPWSCGSSTSGILPSAPPLEVRRELPVAFQWGSR